MKEQVKALTPLEQFRKASSLLDHISKNYLNRALKAELEAAVEFCQDFRRDHPNVSQRFVQIEATLQADLEQQARILRSFDEHLCEKASKISLQGVEQSVARLTG